MFYSTSISVFQILNLLNIQIHNFISEKNKTPPPQNLLQGNEMFQILFSPPPPIPNKSKKKTHPKTYWTNKTKQKTPKTNLTLWNN